MNLSLLDRICEAASRLIQVHPSLHSFAQQLSVKDLAKWTSQIHNEFSAGKPVKPPVEFVSEVKRVVSHSSWAQLSALLTNMVYFPEAESGAALSVHEQESLTMGILWETLLITECSWRSDEMDPGRRLKV